MATSGGHGTEWLPPPVTGVPGDRVGSTSTMRAVDLRHEVEQRARVEGSLIMVDEFINHRVDPGIMRNIGDDIARLLAPRDPEVLLTAEASGIAPPSSQPRRSRSR